MSRRAHTRRWREKPLLVGSLLTACAAVTLAGGAWRHDGPGTAGAEMGFALALLAAAALALREFLLGQRTDIARLARARAELARSEARARMVVEGVGAFVGVVEAGLDGRFLRVNARLCEMLGYGERELLALRSEDITHPDDRALSWARFRPLFDDAAPGGFASQLAKRFVRRDGATLWALSSVILVRGPDGEPASFLAMIQDITDIKRVEHLKDEFVSTVSHELRTPLTSIRGSLGLLAGGVAGDLPPRARALVVIAENNCERLVRLVNDILDSEKIASGKMRFELRPAALRPVIERAIESLDAYARDRGVPVRLEAPVEPIAADIDTDRFIQMLTNLLSNAIRFSPQGSPVVVALARTPAGGARIEVRDRGPGIPPEFQARIFRRFSQADASPARKADGTGLGLSIAKGIVERLRGTIGFVSPPGDGATFHVELPAPAAPPPPAERSATA